jgi:uncharacterized membrane protein YhaH (DUF805 family)
MPRARRGKFIRFVWVVVLASRSTQGVTRVRRLLACPIFRSGVMMGTETIVAQSLQVLRKVDTLALASEGLMSAIRFLFLSTGRINRAKFWLGLLISKIVLFGSIAAIGLTLGGWAAGALCLPLYIWVLSAVSAKRLHDMGMSGWWFAAMLIGPLVLGGVGGAASMPALNAIAGMLWLGMLVILGTVEGTSGSNRFGPDPLQAKRAAEPVTT